VTLAASGLSYGFPGRIVGSEVDLSLASGEIVCMLGPNGSGKTTLLRTLLGLLAPRGGRVTLDDRALGEWSARERAQRLAYVPQAAESDFDFSVQEIVEMGCTPQAGLFAQPAASDRERARAALERLGIAALAPRAIHRVSGGERQLALIARALATGARYLLMDEPTASLDFGNQALILDESVRLRDAGQAVLFTTHHPDHALRIADRVVMMREGGIMAAGGTGSVMNSQNLSGLYGRPVEVAVLTCRDGTRRRVCVPIGGLPDRG